ncbi:MAG: sulfocyanin-like copper-binding protein [Akkermansiaceae bacterium]
MKILLVPTILLTSLGLISGQDKKPAEQKNAGEATTTAGQRCCTALPIGEIKNPVFLKQDPKKKEVEIYLIATFDKSNYGMNFNGVSKSEGGYEIPLGWKVKATFCNNSDVPHSVMVVEEDVAERKINLGDEPYFEGATTPKPNTIGTTNKIEKFEFTPDEAGDFSFACGFPTHSANGHRIFLKIKKDLEKAAFIKPEKKKEDAK